MKKFLVSIALLAGLNGFGQSLDQFVSLQCKGHIPQDFTTLSSKKFETDHAENTDKDLDKDFFMSTRFLFDELLLSGQVLFNDPVTNYVNKLADYVLRDNKELRSELRFYLLRSNTPNAYSTDQGIILFTTGLISQVESEAQLAYILCHEISHYAEKHVRNEYMESQKIYKGRGQYGNANYKSRIEQISNYSKELELEADEKGIDMFLKTEYDVNEIFTGFEVLHYTYLPFDDIHFDTSFFSTPQMVVPGSLFPDTINQVSQEIDYDDAGQTHPNIQKRIDAAMDYLGDGTSKGTKKFIISEEEFFKVRELTRFESINISLSNREYATALYSVYLLQTDYKDNRFLDLSLVKCLYGLTKYKNHNRYSEVTLKPSKVEGESYTLHLFLKNITKQQLNVLTFRHVYDMAKKYPSDKIFQEYLADMKKELALNSGIKPGDFSELSLDDHLANAAASVKEFDIEDSIRKIDASDLSKYEKIRLKKSLNELSSSATGISAEKDFHLFALHDIVAKDNLVQELKQIKKAYDEQLELEKAEAEKDDRVFVDKSKHLGIDKLVVVDPIYENYRLNDKRNHMKSEDKKVSISDMYTTDYNGLKLETQLVDSKNLTSGDVDEYNDLGLLIRWISEVVEHDEIEMISSSHDQVDFLTEKYGTSHFLFSGIYAYKSRSEMTSAHWYGIMFFYTIPIVLIDLMIVHNYFELVALSLDAEKDKVEFTQVSEVNLKGIDGILQAYIYDVLYQLSSNPKKRN
ncbi:MAG: M48 family metalloprotease [Bacteroidetes bacterium]|nr:M48 family metalloprotease [Bacteroidota bacterium]